MIIPGSKVLRSKLVHRCRCQNVPRELHQTVLSGVHLVSSMTKQAWDLANKLEHAVGRSYP